MGEMADFLLENFEAPCEFCGIIHITEEDFENCEMELNLENE